MMTKTMQPDFDLLICGAGPTGLALAAQCLRYGLSFRIIDQKKRPTQLSKALVVHARTLEIYDQLGIAEKAISQGKKVQQLCLLHEGKRHAALHFDHLGEELTPFPFFLLLEQSKTEELLYYYLQEHQRTVSWEENLVTFEQIEPETGDSFIRLETEQADGSRQKFTARYLVGCDGAHSIVRHQLGLPFEGSTHPRLFYVADVTMDFPLKEESIYATFQEKQFLFFFPMYEPKRWRLVGSLSYLKKEALQEGSLSEITFEEVLPQIHQLIPEGLAIQEQHWFSPYSVHTRHVARFQEGNCFLAGDAAHIHTPAGGQGMNTGIQDAYNLAWKLALVQQGKASKELLTTYNEERLANAKELLQTTDQFFDLAAGEHWFLPLVREYVLPLFPQFLDHLPPLKEALFRKISQIGISYRQTASHRTKNDDHFKVEPGDRLPYFSIAGKSIYHLLYQAEVANSDKQPSFHLLLFAPKEKPSLQEQFHQALQKTPFPPLFQSLPLTEKIITLFGSENLQTPFWVIVRPDHYIAYLSHEISEVTSQLAQKITASTSIL